MKICQLLPRETETVQNEERPWTELPKYYVQEAGQGVYSIINMGQFLWKRKKESKDGAKSSEGKVKNHRKIPKK